jgi:hypothetical protein
MTGLRKTLKALLVTVLLAVAVELTPTTVGASTVPTEQPNEFARMLSMVPAASFAPGSNGELYYVDMTLAWDRLGVGTDPDERLEAFGQLGRQETFTICCNVFANRQADLEGARAEVGFSAVEIDREVAVLLPPNSLYIDETSVSADAVVSALETDPLWSAELTEVATDHGTYFTWGEDPGAFNPDRISPLRPLGRPGQLAVLGDDGATTVRTLDPADVESTLAVVGGEGDSAATAGLAAPVVELLAGDDVVQLVGTPRPVAFGPPLNVTAEQLEALLEDFRPLHPYAGIFIVELGDGDHYWTEVLIVHADETAAAANEAIVADILENGVDQQTQEPIAEVFPDADVAPDGAVLRVTLPSPGSFVRAIRMLHNRALFPIA